MSSGPEWPAGDSGGTAPDPYANRPAEPWASPAYPPVPYQSAPAPAGWGAAQPVPYGPGPLGKIRGTGTCILLCLVTLGIYQWVWFYSVHKEMKRHSGTGIDGPVALLLTLFVGIVMPYLTASEVGGLCQRAGQKAPVSGVTGCWYFPGIFLLVGPIVWFVKTNGALNAYWRSLGAS